MFFFFFSYDCYYYYYNLVVSFFKCNAGKGKVRQMAVSEYHLESLKIAKSIWFFFGRFLGWIMSNSWGDLIRILGGCLWIFLSFFLSLFFFRYPSTFGQDFSNSFTISNVYWMSSDFLLAVTELHLWFFFLLWDIRNSYCVCVCVFENYFFIDSSDLARLGRILSSFFSLFFFVFFFFFFFSSLNMLEDCLSVGKYSRGTRKVPCDSWRWIPATAEDVLVLKYRSLWGL